MSHGLSVKARADFVRKEEYMKLSNKKKLELAVKALKKLKSWAEQEPTGPVPIGTQQWVLNVIDRGLTNYE